MDSLERGELFQLASVARLRRSLIFWCLLLLTFILRTWRPQARTLPMIVAASAWVLFGLLEYEAYRERANIRVDLLFTWPALLLVTVACCGLWLYSLFAVRRQAVI
ncbi:MAG: hypothetical protein ACR2H4_19330 [Pyrinomonadaceae bacterium]